MVRVSIIIPFYNVEPYIAQCLDSVYQQDIPEEEYEVICVNDASPDGSWEIVKQYQKKHSNLILVEHEVNKKLGAARNTGRKIAKGKYLWNVDSDDMIVPNCLKEMLDLCEREDLDVLMFGARYLKNGNTDECKPAVWNEDAEPSSGITFWLEQGIPHQREISAVWTQVYRREYLDKNDIYSPEINMSEDVPYTYASILLADRVKAINTPYYIYRVNMESLTGALHKHPNPRAVYENSFVSTAFMYSLMKRVGKYDQRVPDSLMAVTRHIIILFTQFGQSFTQDERKEFLSLCRKNYLKNLFVYRILSNRQGWKYTKFLLNGIVPKYSSC